ncbi:MAG TPA: FAD-binding oxidoreductase [Kribbella sp.]
MPDLPELPEVLSDRAVGLGDRRYPRLRSTYTKVHSPKLILMPRNASEVAAAVVFAGASELPLSVRSGGHGLSGQSSNDGGIVIDLSELDQIEVVDRDARIVRIGPGARWATVADALAPYGWAISSGDHGNVGVGGLATAGGIGWFARSYGLTIDHIRAVDVVLADGRQVRADADNEPDLFWAMRGAGDSVGIAVAFEIEAVPLPDVGIAQLLLEADRNGDTLRRWSEHLAAAPLELTTNGIMFSQGGSFLLQLTAVVADGNLRLAKPLGKLGLRLVDQHAQLAPYSALVPTAHLHPNMGQQSSISTSGLLPTLTRGSARALMDVSAHPTGPLLQLRSVGGAINAVDPEATAYPHRHQQVLAILSEFPPSGGAELDAAWRAVVPYVDGAYRNFESRPTERTFRQAFPGVVGDRVSKLRDHFDPAGVLRRQT